MAYIKNPLSGGGGGGAFRVVNGVIKQYVSDTENIDANTFVEFVCNWDRVRNTQDTKLNPSLTKVTVTAAAKLSDSKVFVAYCDTTNNYSGDIYGVVCNINGDGTVTYGTSTLLVSHNSGSPNIGIGVMVSSNGMVIVGHADASYPYAVSATVSGDTITVGTNVQLTTSSVTVSYAKLQQASADNGLMLYGATGSLYAFKVYDNSGVIGHSTRATLSSMNAAGQFAMSVIDTDKVFVTASSGSNLYLYGAVVDISGSSVSAGTRTAIDQNSNTGRFSGSATLASVGAGDYKVLVAYPGSGYELTGVIINVSGNTFTVGTPTSLSGASYSGYGLDYGMVVKTGDNKAIVFHQQGGEGTYQAGYAAMMACKVDISGGSISVIDDSVVGVSVYGAAVPLDSSSIFISHAVQSANGFMVYADGDPVAIKTATDSHRIAGVTTQSITPNTPGNVWVLNTSESE